MTQFKIDIVSDTVCPWCYVGKQKLDRAIAAYKAAHPDRQDTFSTTWKPFYLNPDAPKIGIDKRSYYYSKFGEERSHMMFQRLSTIGASVGIAFKYGGKTGSTRDSHRLIQLGKSKSLEMQTKVVEELFSAYFENERDITEWGVLVDAAVKAGLEEKEAWEWLKSGEGGKEVDEEVREAQESMINGVPNFTIQNRMEIGGAQEPAAFVQAFERIRMMEESKA